jgi:hypothetical protein
MCHFIFKNLKDRPITLRMEEWTWLNHRSTRVLGSIIISVWESRVPNDPPTRLAEENKVGAPIIWWPWAPCSLGLGFQLWTIQTASSPGPTTIDSKGIAPEAEWCRVTISACHLVMCRAVGGHRCLHDQTMFRLGPFRSQGARCKHLDPWDVANIRDAYQSHRLFTRRRWWISEYKKRGAPSTL